MIKRKTETDKIINLKPVFINKDTGINIFTFDSIFLYVFLFLETAILILIMYFFFTKEIKFMYHNLLFKDRYTEEDKIKYNTFMESIKALYDKPKSCLLIDKIIDPITQETIIDQAHAMYDGTEHMLALNGEYIHFVNMDLCKLFVEKQNTKEEESIT